MFLSLTNIKKSFGQGDSRVEVLKGIDLSIEKGEFCVLLGKFPLRKINFIEYHRWH